MTEKVSTIDVRQRIGDMLNRVSLRHDEFIIERKGKALAALVPVERLEQMRRFARTQGTDFFEQQKGSGLTEPQPADLGLEAQKWVRRHHRRNAENAHGSKILPRSPLWACRSSYLMNSCERLAKRPLWRNGQSRRKLSIGPSSADPLRRRSVTNMLLPSSRARETLPAHFLTE